MSTGRMSQPSISSQIWTVYVDAPLHLFLLHSYTTCRHHSASQTHVNAPHSCSYVWTNIRCWRCTCKCQMDFSSSVCVCVCVCWWSLNWTVVFIGVLWITTWNTYLPMIYKVYKVCCGSWSATYVLSVSGMLDLFQKIWLLLNVQCTSEV